MTQNIGLIGHPLKHSISPAFQQAALDYYGLDIRYEKWDAEAKDLELVVGQLRQTHNLGANITVPHKEAVMQFLDKVDELAETIGAVNTIVNQCGKLEGFNTDAHGFLRSLHDDATFDPANKRVLILGAGGAARAVGFALVQERIARLVITNRTIRRANAIVDSLATYCSARNLHVSIDAVPLLDSHLQEIAHESQLIVNCTTTGMRYSPDEERSILFADAISRDALVYDLVYNPSETPLLKMAGEVGAKTLGGLSMLIYQGAVSFEMWTGREAPVDIMLNVATQAILRGVT